MSSLRLGDVSLKIGSGATPRGGKDVYLQSGDIALIRSQNVYNDRFERPGLVYLTPEHAKQLDGVSVQAGDVLLNITGDSVARACQVPDDVLPARVNQHVAIIRPDPELVDPRFLRFFLVSPSMQQHMLGLAAAGATRHALTKGMIESFIIPKIPLAEQRAIGVALGALEDKIDRNRRTNKTLEAMAQTLFKDWFVDFGPVRAKLEGREPPGLSPEIAALFPAAMAEDGMPVGWGSTSLAEVTGYLNRGVSPKYVEHGGVLVLNQKCIRNNIVDPSKGRRHDNTLKGIGGRELLAGDILVNSTGVGTLGRVAQILHLSETTIVDSHVTVVRASSPVSANYLGLDLLGRQTQIEALGEGSTGQTELSRTKLGQLRVVLPSKDVLRNFDLITNPFRDQLSANLLESKSLASLRDLLLPRLMSGEIRIADVEQLIGDTE
jgi:type I restriction enzyme S subunit